MRRLTKAVALVIVLMLYAQTMVLAQGSYLTNVAHALKHGSVYVDPSIPGTGSDTVSTLQSVLTQGDNIVLVLLPKSAEAKLKADPTTIATRLSKILGNQQIIGLAIGNMTNYVVVGYAPTLPTGVATGQMDSASNVSNDPVTALQTFAINIEQWLSTNPHPTPKKKSHGSDDSTWLYVILVAVLAIGLAVWLLVNRNKNRASQDRTSFEAPDKVRTLLTKIAHERQQVQDREFRTTLFEMCRYVEKYFKTVSTNKNRDTSLFADHLDGVSQVLSKYIQIQREGEFFYSPEEKMEEGKRSITSFSDSVLEAIRQRNAAGLTNYKVDTQILSATTYR